jgi:hypothetical protein
VEVYILFYIISILFYANFIPEIEWQVITHYTLHKNSQYDKPFVILLLIETKMKLSDNANLSNVRNAFAWPL